MTTRELAQLRDRVARRQIEVEVPRVRKGWTPRRDAAGNAALAALREAEARGKPHQRRDAGVTTGKRRPRVLQRRCVYCGTPTLKRGWPLVCHGHSDLPKLDAAYLAELELRGVAC